METPVVLGKVHVTRETFLRTRMLTLIQMMYREIAARDETMERIIGLVHPDPETWLDTAPIPCGILGDADDLMAAYATDDPAQPKFVREVIHVRSENDELDYHHHLRSMSFVMRLPYKPRHTLELSLESMPRLLYSPYGVHVGEIVEIPRGMRHAFRSRNDVCLISVSTELFPGDYHTN